MFNKIYKKDQLKLVGLLICKYNYKNKSSGFKSKTLAIFTAKS